MRILFVNPITICFALLASALLIIVMVLGGNLGEAATMIFTPYLSDITERFGKDGKIFIQAISAIAQIVMLAFIVVLVFLEKRYARITVSILGVLLVVGYFAFLIVVQLIGSIH